VLVTECARADMLVLGRHVNGWGVGSIMHTVLSHGHGTVATVPGGYRA
jgi:hypothetical protein